MASIAFLRATTARLRRLFSSLIWSSVSLSSLLRICIDDRVTETSSYIFLYVSCSSFASRVRRWRRDRSHVTDAPRPPGTAQLSNCISVSQVIMSLFLFSISISIYLSFGYSANGGFTGALILGSPVLALSPSTLHKVPRSEPPPPVSYAETASQPHSATVPGSPATVPGSPATVPGSPATVPGGFAAGLFTTRRSSAPRRCLPSSASRCHTGGSPPATGGSQDPEARRGSTSCGCPRRGTLSSRQRRTST